MIWILVLITYIACAEPIEERVGKGRFETYQACEEARIDVLKSFGPPPPGSQLVCKAKEA